MFHFAQIHTVPEIPDVEERHVGEELQLQGVVAVQGLDHAWDVFDKDVRSVKEQLCQQAGRKTRSVLEEVAG